ncbi:MAG: M48 family metallopeptidase [Gammaproteobacteria bacterium]|nr:M48 family metallopeptidase [Gammaproteobacteria bacterium]
MDQLHNFTLFFLAMLSISTLMRLYLSQRQINYVAKHRAEVPDSFADKISLEDHQKAADYTTAKVKFGRLPLAYEVALLLIWTIGGGLQLLNENILTLDLSPILTGITVILVFTFISSLLDLPFSIYSTFVIEEKFGFNRTTIKTFITDMIKGSLLGLAIGVPLLYVILWLMEQTGDLWWLYTWIVISGFSLFMMWVYPTWIAPIFNKFEPLEEGETLDRITSLLNRCGFNSNGIFVIDGSKRSSHGNAYFSGFGRNKRIVFFDTLLKMLSDDELEAVLAHELGHFKKKHIIKGMAISFGTTLLALAILAWLMKAEWFYTSLGVAQPSTYMALLLFTLVLPAFTFVFQPLFSIFSRKNEFEADAFAAEQTDAKYLIHALVGLYRENASTLTPDPVYSAFYDSHPPAPVRISQLNAHA